MRARLGALPLAGVLVAGCGWSAAESGAAAGTGKAETPNANLIITSPPPGSRFQPGAQITLTAEGAGDFVPDAVWFSVADGDFWVESPPFTVTVVIPKDALGTYAVVATGIDSKTRRHEVSAPRSYEVDATARLRELIIEPSRLITYSGLREGRFRTRGRFEDGVVRSLPDDWITFKSSDNTVVAVASDGSYFAKQKGRATIWVRAAGAEAAAYFEVAEPPLLIGAHEPDAETVGIQVGALRAGQAFDVFAGEARGYTDHPTCTRLPLQIAGAQVVASGTADAEGNGSVAVPFPASSKAMLLQVTSEDCSVSKSLSVTR